MSNTPQGKYRSLRSLEWLNFFLADVQTGLGPFLAAYLASNGWHPDRVGFALTFGGLVTVALQTPAGAAIDAVHRKRTLLAVCIGVLVAAAFLLMGNLNAVSVYSAQFLIGGSGAFLAPTVAAITLGIVGAKAFDTHGTLPGAGRDSSRCVGHRSLQSRATGRRRADGQSSPRRAKRWP